MQPFHQDPPGGSFQRASPATSSDHAARGISSGVSTPGVHIRTPLDFRRCVSSKPRTNDVVIFQGVRGGGDKEEDKNFKI